MDGKVVLPPEVKKYFWGDDLSKLDWETHRQYIVSTLLEKGDEKAMRWLLSVTKPETITSLLPHLKLSPKSARFWSLYLS